MERQKKMRMRCKGRLLCLIIAIVFIFSGMHFDEDEMYSLSAYAEVSCPGGAITRMGKITPNDIALSENARLVTTALEIVEVRRCELKNISRSGLPVAELSRSLILLTGVFGGKFDVPFMRGSFTGTIIRYIHQKDGKKSIV